MSKIAEALAERFQQHRIVLWYDEQQDFLAEYEALDLAKVEKIQVQGNEFAVKYKVIKQAPEQQFLLYFTHKKPAHEDNWLLDIELAHYVFHTEQEALFLQELGLGYHLKELVEEHFAFFKSKERRDKLKELLGKGDEHQAIRYKLLAVLFGTEHTSLTAYIHAHATLFAKDDSQADKDLERYNLTDFYWKEISRIFHYQNDKASIYDLLIEVFNNNFALRQKTNLAKDSGLILSLWKDSLKYRESFGAISEKVAKDTHVETDLQSAVVEQIINDDLFQLSDRKIIIDLAHRIASKEISNTRLVDLVKQRENKFWYTHFEYFYKSLEAASHLIALIDKYAQTKYESFEEGTADYANRLYEIDLWYRKFIFYYIKTNQNNVLATLAQKVEKAYTNDWLLTYNDNWQNIIDKLEKYPITLKSQRQFYNTYIKPNADEKHRWFVIISDALRYENGVELCEKLQNNNYYEASMDYMEASLPSFTQLGMASLLPHTNLEIKEGSDAVLVDGMPSNGLNPRKKILDTNSSIRTTAILAKDFMNLKSKGEGRDFVKQYDVIYIYHNHIDKTGDDTTSEERIFEAVEEELEYLINLVKKVNSMNGYNMLITSDHGYIYQHNKLDESDFSTSEHKGEVWKSNRRFVIGKDLQGDTTTKSFSGNALGLQTGIDVLVPKSINRLRVSGAGSRFIHGGSSLQEIVVPLVKVSKKRVKTTSQVEIDIIKSTDKITTNILAVSFIQTDLVTSQVLPRSIQAAIFAEDGEQLSNIFKYVFDKEEGSERQREVKCRFQLSAKASGKYKNQRVQLILKEPVKSTDKWKEYKSFSYTLNISFANDFDDF